MSRRDYITNRLMELSYIAENRELDKVEKAEERRLLKELAKLDKQEK